MRVNHFSKTQLYINPILLFLAIATLISPGFISTAISGEIMSYAYRGMWDGDGTLRCGVVMTGYGSTPIAMRVLGPSLEPYSQLPKYPNPEIQTKIAGQAFDHTNKRWADQDNNNITDSPSSRATFLTKLKKAGMVGFSGIIGAPPEESYDCALAFDSGPVTRMILIDGDNLSSPGEFLFEWANADSTTDVDAVNVSVRRKFINGNQDILAFTLPQGPDQLVLITARGPSIAALIGSMPALSDPVIALYNEDGDQISYNNDWWNQVAGAFSRNDIINAVNIAGQQPFAGNNSNTKDAAILTYLGPGDYSIYLSGGLSGPQIDGEVVLSASTIPDYLSPL